jgi:hypothetical protein
MNIITEGYGAYQNYKNVITDAYGAYQNYKKDYPNHKLKIIVKELKEILKDTSIPQGQESLNCQENSGLRKPRKIYPSQG